MFRYSCLSLLSETMKWEKVKAKGDVPPGVAAHASVTFGKNIFIFGGLTSEGATNSMFKFHCGEYSYFVNSRRHSWMVLKKRKDERPLCCRYPSFNIVFYYKSYTVKTQFLLGVVGTNKI